MVGAQDGHQYLLVTLLEGGVTLYRSGGCGAPARVAQDVVAKDEVSPGDYTWVCRLCWPPKATASGASAGSGTSSSGSEASAPTMPGSPTESLAEG